MKCYEQFSVFGVDQLGRKCGHLWSKAKCFGLSIWYEIEKELILSPHIELTLSPLQLVYIALCAGDRGGTVVKVLCYKSEGHWFEPSFRNPSDCTMVLGSTQPLTEMSTRSVSWR